jgi:uncharacterized damage-inducible protein DinB
MKKKVVKRRSTSRKRASSKPKEGSIGAEFIRTARLHLMGEYLPKFHACLDQLSDEDVWWRAHETDNSVGNLMLHLCGNMRQWIIAGLGGQEFSRDRDKEFSERRKIPKDKLLGLFEKTVQDVDAVLDSFDPSKLTEVRHFQKWDYTCLYAISHVVEHVSQHMGQIIYITKLKKEVDLKLVRV